MTFLFILFCTIAGCFIGDHFFEGAYIIGGCIGAIIGLALRYGSCNAAEGICDIID